MTKFNKSLEDISPRVTPLTVGIVLDPAAVGLFHVAFRLGMLLSQPVIVLVGTVYPELTRLVKAQEMAGAHQLVVRSGLIAAAAGTPFLAIYLLFGHSILDTVGGTGFAAAYSVLVLIAASQVIQLLGFPLGSALQAIGQADVVLRTNLIAMAVLVPALIVLLQIYGLIGAGLYAGILAALVVGFLGIIWWKRTR